MLAFLRNILRLIDADTCPFAQVWVAVHSTSKISDFPQSSPSYNLFNARSSMRSASNPSRVTFVWLKSLFTSWKCSRRVMAYLSNGRTRCTCCDGRCVTLSWGSSSILEEWLSHHSCSSCLRGNKPPLRSCKGLPELSISRSLEIKVTVPMALSPQLECAPLPQRWICWSVNCLHRKSWAVIILSENYHLLHS